MYEVRLEGPAKRFLKKLDKENQKRIIKKHGKLLVLVIRIGHRKNVYG